MVLATFYFLFQRKNDIDYLLWRGKARVLVLMLFVCTAFAFMGLIFMTNLHFSYFLLSSTENICANNTSQYTIPGLIFGITSFFMGFYLIL